MDVRPDVGVRDGQQAFFALLHGDGDRRRTAAIGRDLIEVSSLHSAVAAGTASPYELAARIGSGYADRRFGSGVRRVAGIRDDASQCDVDVADSADPDQSQIFRDRIRTY